MTQAPEAPILPGHKRVGVQLPADVARRLRTWAALCGQPVSHIAADMITAALPTDGQLAAQIRQSEEADGHADA
jgi:hypothetical protein